MEGAAQALSDRAHDGLRRGEPMVDGKIRRPESPGVTPAGNRRHQAAAVSESGDGGVRESLVRAVRRTEREERALETHLPRVEEVPGRAVLMVPRSRSHVRKLRVLLQDQSRSVRARASRAERT